MKMKALLGAEPFLDLLALLFPSFPGLFRRVSSCFVVTVPGLLA